MLESIADRLTRERKERELAAMSRPENAASRNWGITGSTYKMPPALCVRSYGPLTETFSQ
jgi:hypothetical protein